MSTFERIKKLASKQGYSLNSLNNAAGLGARSIYRWDKMRPSDENLKKVAKVLGTSLKYLRTGKEPLSLTTNDNIEKEILKSYRQIAKGFGPGEKKLLLKYMNKAAQETDKMIKDVHKRQQKKKTSLTKEKKKQNRYNSEIKSEHEQELPSTNIVMEDNIDLNAKHFFWHGKPIPDDIVVEIRNYAIFLMHQRKDKIKKQNIEVDRADLEDAKYRKKNLFNNEKK